MFKCEICKRITDPGEKQYKKVVKTREKTYSYNDKYDRPRTSAGFEIVKELKVCENCMKEVDVNERTKKQG